MARAARDCRAYESGIPAAEAHARLEFDLCHGDRAGQISREHAHVSCRQRGNNGRKRDSESAAAGENLLSYSHRAPSTAGLAGNSTSPLDETAKGHHGETQGSDI